MARELTLPLPAPPAIIQQQRREWNVIISELAQYAMRDDQNALAMGDKLREIEEQWGKPHVQIAAEQAGVAWAVARQRCWVSKCLPPGHPLRKTPLSFCHLRALAGTESPEAWAAKALEGQWSVATLRDQINRAGDEAATLAGAPCIQCEQPLKEGDRIVSFHVDRGKRARCCSARCALAYFTELVESDLLIKSDTLVESDLLVENDREAALHPEAGLELAQEG